MTTPQPPQPPRPPPSDTPGASPADARARETALREILQAISSSRTDTAPVFDLILRSAAQLSGAPFANLCLLDVERSHWHLVAHFGDGLRHLSTGETATPLDSKLVPATAMRTARVVQIEDLSDTDLYRRGDPGRVAMVDVEGMRTIVCVPLLIGAQAIGCITLFRREVKAFSIDEITLVETFAEQAVIAIENVRQFNKLQTRLEREVATSEVLKAISQSRDDEMPVFKMIQEHAARLCNAPFSGLFILDQTGENLRLVLHTRSEPTYLGDAESVWPLSGISAMARAVVRKKAIKIDNLSETDAYLSGDPGTIRAVDLENISSFLAVPLLSNGQGIGCIGLYRVKPAPFSDDQMELVKTFAEQAVIAIENTRQFREVQTRLEREAATREILQVISQSRTDTAPVFEVILRNAARLCGAPMASMAICNDERTHLVMQAHWGDTLTHLAVDQTNWPLDGPTSNSIAVREQRVVHTEDLKDTDAYRGGDPGRVEAVDKEGIRTFLAVPLLADGLAIGCIALYRREVRPFDDSQTELVQSFAAQAVIAIENVRQFKALEALNAELGDRVRKQVDEIERIGRLRRFLSPQVADVVVSSGDENLLGSHRAMIAILFCDIRGFTAFCESAEPEETIEVLQTFHETLGRLIHAAGAGFDHRAGDGIMVVFNDPVPCDDPAGAALRVAVQMRECMVEICTKWRKLGHRMGFGVGISLGYATVGMVGFEGRYDYTASGTAVNLAARLCDQAADQEILLSRRAASALEDIAVVASAGELTLKGFHAPVDVFRVTEMKDIQ